MLTSRLCDTAKDAPVTAIFADSTGHADVGIQTLEDGAVRALAVTNDQEASTQYDYQFETADGVVMYP